MADEPTSADFVSRKWTRIEDYWVRFGRRSPPPLAARTEPEDPRFVLSTLPFMILIVFLVVIGIGIMVLAWPGNRSAEKVEAPPREQGVAQRGWYDDAKDEFRNPETTDRQKTV